MTGTRTSIGDGAAVFTNPPGREIFRVSSEGELTMNATPLAVAELIVEEFGYVYGSRLRAAREREATARTDAKRARGELAGAESKIKRLKDELAECNRKNGDLARELRAARSGE